MSPAALQQAPRLRARREYSDRCSVGPFPSASFSFCVRQQKHFYACGGTRVGGSYFTWQPRFHLSQGPCLLPKEIGWIHGATCCFQLRTQLPFVTPGRGLGGADWRELGRGTDDLVTVSSVLQALWRVPVDTVSQGSPTR